MPNRDTAPIGAPCWVDLMTSDVERSRAFYREVFGWTSEEPNAAFGGYFNFARNGSRVAGGMAATPDTGVANVWSIYLATDDARKTVDVVADNGGEVLVPPTDVADLGTMAMVRDSSGAAIGMWQPGTFAGFTTYAEPNAPSWFELQTRDYEAAISFYRNVFRWDTLAASDTPELHYTVQRVGDLWLAGIMDGSAYLPENVPPFWAVYFGTDDTDATLAKIVELGGSIVQPAEDTPYGRLAAAADPMGAVFKLIHGPA